MNDSSSRRKAGGGFWKAVRRFLGKARESGRVLRDEYVAGRDEGVEGMKGVGETEPTERKQIPHRDLGPASEEPPPSS